MGVRRHRVAVGHLPTPPFDELRHRRAVRLDHRPGTGVAAHEPATGRDDAHGRSLDDLDASAADRSAERGVGGAKSMARWPHYFLDGHVRAGRSDAGPGLHRAFDRDLALGDRP